MTSEEALERLIAVYEQMTEEERSTDYGKVIKEVIDNWRY